MTTRKNYNSIVFLTTLSVYLGLVLVGAPPSVLAQQNKVVFRQADTAGKSDSRNRVEKTACSELDGAEIIKLLAKYDVNLTPFDFSYRIDFSENQPTNLSVIFAQGDKTFVDAFRQTVACLPSEQKGIRKGKQAQSRPAGEINRALSKSLFALTSAVSGFKANEQEIVLSKTLVYAHDEAAENFANFSRSATEHARKIEIEFPQLFVENKLQSAIFNNTVFSFAGNQVFIVTRLPRGSLDALLTEKSAK